MTIQGYHIPSIYKNIVSTKRNMKHNKMGYASIK